MFPLDFAGFGFAPLPPCNQLKVPPTSGRPRSPLRPPRAKVPPRREDATRTSTRSRPATRTSRRSWWLSYSPSLPPRNRACLHSSPHCLRLLMRLPLTRKLRPLLHGLARHPILNARTQACLRDLACLSCTNTHVGAHTNKQSITRQSKQANDQ